MKQPVVLACLAVGLAAALFLSFKSLFLLDMSPYASELAAGFLGSVITVIVTAILLSAQSANELRKEKSVGVFQSKLACYNEFVTFLNDVIRDGKIEEDEVRELEHWALRLALISGPDITACLVCFIDQAIVLGKYRFSDLTPQEVDRWRAWYASRYGMDEVDDDEFISIGEVLYNMKLDLGEADISSESRAESTSNIIDSMFDDRLPSVAA